MFKIQANIDGMITNIKKIQANIGGTITNIKKVQANIGGVIKTIWTLALQLIVGNRFLQDNMDTDFDYSYSRHEHTIAKVTDTLLVTIMQDKNNTYPSLEFVNIDDITVTSVIPKVASFTNNTTIARVFNLANDKYITFEFVPSVDLLYACVRDSATKRTTTAILNIDNLTVYNIEMFENKFYIQYQSGSDDYLARIGVNLSTNAVVIEQNILAGSYGVCMAVCQYGILIYNEGVSATIKMYDKDTFAFIRTLVLGNTKSHSSGGSIHRFLHMVSSDYAILGYADYTDATICYIQALQITATNIIKVGSAIQRNFLWAAELQEGRLFISYDSVRKGMVVKADEIGIIIETDEIPLPYNNTNAIMCYQKIDNNHIAGYGTSITLGNSEYQIIKW